MAAGRWVGRGDKVGGDGAAVDAMRKLINSIPMRGVVVIGEGEKDNAPMLFNGEHVGDGTGPEVDVAVDPIDGTTLMSKGMPNALAVLAVAERGAMFDPSAVFDMEKFAVGPDCADVIDINAGVAENLRRIAKVKRSSVSESPSASSTGPATPTLVDESAGRGPDPVHLRRRHRGRDQRGPGPSRRRRADGHRRHPRRASSPPARSSAWAARSRPNYGRATRPNGRRRSPPGTTWTGYCTTDELVTGDNCFFVATGVTCGDLLRGSGTAPAARTPSRSSCGPRAARSGSSTRTTGWRSSPCTRPSTSTAAAGRAGARSQGRRPLRTRGDPPDRRREPRGASPGSRLAVQSRINGELGVRLDDGIAAASSRSAVACWCCWCWYPPLPAGRGAGRPARRPGGTLRPWQCLGGACGALLVATQGLTVGTLGVAVFIVAVVAGQSVSSLLVDRAGIGPAGPQPVTVPRLVGAALTVVAVLLAVGDRLGDPGTLVLAAAALLGRRRHRLAAGGQRPGTGGLRQRADRQSGQLLRRYGGCWSPSPRRGDTRLPGGRPSRRAVALFGRAVGIMFIAIGAAIAGTPACCCSAWARSPASRGAVAGPAGPRRPHRPGPVTLLGAALTLSRSASPPSPRRRPAR